MFGVPQFAVGLYALTRLDLAVSGSVTTSLPLSTGAAPPLGVCVADPLIWKSSTL